MLDITFNLVATVIFLAVAFMYFIAKRISSHGILSAVILRLHDCRSSSLFHALARIMIGKLLNSIDTYDSSEGIFPLERFSTFFYLRRTKVSERSTNFRSCGESF